MLKDSNGRWIIPQDVSSTDDEPVRDQSYVVPFALYPSIRLPSGSVNLAHLREIRGNELNVPLSFWFSSNPELSISQVAIPFGPRQIYVTLRSAEELLVPIENTGG